MKAIGAWVRPYIDARTAKRQRDAFRLLQRRRDLIGVYALADVLAEGVTASA